MLMSAMPGAGTFARQRCNEIDIDRLGIDRNALIFDMHMCSKNMHSKRGMQRRALPAIEGDDAINHSGARFLTVSRR